MKAQLKREKLLRRRKKVRAKISNTTTRPRLCVFRSSSHIYAKLIDDKKKITIASASDLELKKSKAKADSAESLKSKVGKAKEVGKLIAEKGLNKKIEKVVFDRRSYKYHGKVKALAEGA